MKSSWSTMAAPTATFERAQAAGARVVYHCSWLRSGLRGRRRGGGFAIWRFLFFSMATGVTARSSCEQLVRPIAQDEADFVIGSRTRGVREPGSMSFQPSFRGSIRWLAAPVALWVKYGDVAAAFRAIRRQDLGKVSECASKLLAGIWKCRCARPEPDCASSRSR